MTIQRTATFCKYSGVKLSNTPKLFIRENSVHYSKHWIFDCSWQELQSYHYQYNGSGLTEEQSTLLALAYILHPTSIGTKIKLTKPVLLDTIYLQRQFGQIVYITSTIAELSPVRRSKVLSNLPNFSIDHIRSTQEAGQLLLTFVCDTLANILYTHLDLDPIRSANLQVLDDVDAAELQLTREAKKKVALVEALTGTTTESIKTQTKYWDYILHDIEHTYSIPRELITAYKKEITTPTNKGRLEELKTLLKGLKEATKLNGRNTIPSMQLSFAIGSVTDMINAIIKKHEKLNLNLNLKPAETITGATKPAIEITTVSTNSATSRIEDKLAAITAKLSDSDTKKQQAAEEFVVRFTDNK